mgnify:CR=1 FL=1
MNYREYNPEQIQIFGYKPEDVLSEDHLVYLVDEIIVIGLAVGIGLCIGIRRRIVKPYLQSMLTAGSGELPKDIATSILPWRRGDAEVGIF